MRAETVRRRLRPYIGDIVDICYIVPNRDVNKYQHLLNCIELTENYPEVLLYLDLFLRKFTCDELNGNNFNNKRIFNNERIFNAIYCNRLKFNDKIFELLIQHGADINLLCTCGFTQLARAVCDVYFDKHEGKIIKLFLENGADVNQEFTINGKKYTVLTYVLWRIHCYKPFIINTVKSLIDYGANFDLEKINEFDVDDEIKSKIIEYYNSTRGKFTKAAN